MFQNINSEKFRTHIIFCIPKEIFKQFNIQTIKNI
jgi:hypothetical protein